MLCQALCYTMLSSIHRQERLASGYIAGEAFSFAGGVRLAVQDAAGTSPKPEFDPQTPRQLSGTVAVAPVAAPDRPPRDGTPERATVGNIRLSVFGFQRVALSLNMPDGTRHEYPSSRQAN